MELSGLTYRALQKITGLCYLHVRLDGGPLPKLRQVNSLNYYPPLPPADTYASMSGISSSNFNVHGSHRNALSKRKKKRGYSFWSDSRPFSGFTTLKSLEITRLSNLDTLNELRQCIKACSRTLRSLTLTIDSRFGSRPGRVALTPPPNDFDSLSETDLDDDELLDVPTSQTGDVSEAERRQEKMALEGVLAILFDLQGSAAQGRRLERKLGLEGGKCFVEEDRASTQEKLENVIKSLREDEITNGKDAPLSSFRLERYRMMRDLADLFINKHDPKSKKSSKVNHHSLPTTKKHSKPTKYKPAPYPAPVDIDEIEWEPQTADPLPWTLEPNPGESSTKPWLQPSKSSQNSKKYPLDPLPPLPFTSSTGSSIDTSVPYPLESSKSHHTNGNLYPSGVNKIKSQLSTTKSLPLSSQDATPLSPSYALYSNSSSATLPAKPPGPKYKQGSKAKTGSSSKLPPLGPYEGSASNKKIPTPALNTNIGFNDFKYPGSSHKTHVDPKWKAKSSKTWSSDSSSSDSASDSSSYSRTSLTTPFFAAESGKVEDDEIDIDIEHPDADGVESFDDQQEIGSGSEDTEIQSSRKNRDPFAIGPRGFRNGSNHRDRAIPQEASPSGSNTAKMHEYVRSTHGIQLETLRLQHVPLKASILGKAVDLWTLQHITLLEAGRQDTFWALLAKLTNIDAPITFRTIHTDQASFSLLRYLETFHTLEELFIHERRTRNKDSDSDVLLDIQSIRKQALRPHVGSLRRVMLRNDRNDHWDLDFETLVVLGRQAKQLTELAISLKSQVYHWLLQLLPSFNSLRALHLITLRGPDRGPSMHFESLAYSLDSLTQCVGLKLRYLAIAERVADFWGHEQFRKRVERMMDNSEEAVQAQQSDKKGKGKALETAQAPVDSASDHEMDSTLGMMQAAHRKLRAFRRLEDVKGIKVFCAEVRMGRL